LAEVGTNGREKWGTCLAIGKTEWEKKKKYKANINGFVACTETHGWRGLIKKEVIAKAKVRGIYLQDKKTSRQKGRVRGVA